MPDTTRNFRSLWTRLCASAATVLLAGSSLLVASDGVSAYLTKQATDHSSPEEATDAIRYNPRNATAYSARAAIYQDRGQIREAISDLEKATELRSGNHLLWLRLGFLRYVEDDMSSAIDDFRAATIRAPFYAQPRWYLGVALLESNQLEEGFREIRLAIAADPSYMERAIQYAAETYDGDPSKLLSALAPDSSHERMTLAQYFLKQNNIRGVLELAGKGGANLTVQDRQTLISDLIAAKQFAAAHEIWQTPDFSGPQNASDGAITNGGFEADHEIGGSGFNWYSSSNLQRVNLQRDPTQPATGSFCLRLDFSGNSAPALDILSQIVLVTGGANYQLDFAARSRKLVTGGPPFVEVRDAATAAVLAQSRTLPANQPNWEQYSLQFSAPAEARAVIIVLKRANCSSSPCPAFGQAWFDNFVFSSR